MRETSIPSVAIFARPPVAGHAKTRLIPLLGAPGAARFQAALISDTLRKVAGLGGFVKPYLFLAASPITLGRSNAEAILLEQPLAGAGIRGISVFPQQGRDLGERLENAFRRLLRLHSSCVVIGTDSPLFPARILRQALGELRACESVLGPCPDGGYYLIALRRPANPATLQSIFRKVRWSTAFAFSDTLRNLLQEDLSCSVLEACADVRPALRPATPEKGPVPRPESAPPSPRNVELLERVRRPSSVAKTSRVTTDN